MFVPKINFNTRNVKQYQKQNSVKFQGSYKPVPAKYPDVDYWKEESSYKTILSYNQISALKNFAEKKVNNGNVAIVFFEDAAGDTIYIKGQNELNENSGSWLDISDYENA